MSAPRNPRGTAQPAVPGAQSAEPGRPLTGPVRPPTTPDPAPAEPGRSGQLFRAGGAALVGLLAVALPLAECFLVPARVAGTPVPVAAALAVVATPATMVWMRRVSGSSWAGLVPGVLWVLIALVASTPRAEGDLIVPGTGMGVAFLLAGFASTAVTVGVMLPSTRAGRGR